MMKKTKKSSKTKDNSRRVENPYLAIVILLTVGIIFGAVVILGL